MPFDHERLDVYRVALDFIIIADDTIAQLPRGNGNGHMMRDVLTDAPTLPVTPADVQRAVRVLAQVCRRVIRSPDLELLVEVARTHALPAGDGVRCSTAGWLVLAYLNGDEWYDLHPLARRAPEVKARLATVSSNEARCRQVVLPRHRARYARSVRAR